jgi:hypothetical protein
MRACAQIRPLVLKSVVFVAYWSQLKIAAFLAQISAFIAQLVRAWVQ